MNTNTTRCNKFVDTWTKIVDKMPCGRKVEIPLYGTLRAYKTKYGRRFSLSNSVIQAGGNLPVSLVKQDIKSVAKFLNEAN